MGMSCSMSITLDPCWNLGLRNGMYANRHHSVSPHSHEFVTNRDDDMDESTGQH